DTTPDGWKILSHCIGILDIVGSIGAYPSRAVEARATKLAIDVLHHGLECRRHADDLVPMACEIVLDAAMRPEQCAELILTADPGEKACAGLVAMLTQWPVRDYQYSDQFYNITVAIART